MRKHAGSGVEVPTDVSVEDLTIDGMVKSQYMAGDARDVFAKTEAFTLTDLARAAKLYPFFQPLDCNEGPEARIYGRRVLMLGSNNYLGLTRHPRVMEAARQAVADHGTSMTGSRFLNGTNLMHERLEQRLAEFFGKEGALVFTTGYQTNLGVISALIDRHSVAIVDKADHASIYDGCQLAEGEMIRFRHNDPDHLESVLSELDDERGRLVIVDGVFSMEGDIINLPRVAEVCQRYQARLMVDDAHAIGVLGHGGRGTASHFGLTEEVDLIVGTFSKSLASIGGFLAGSAKVLEWVKHFGRSMMFSASLPPASTAAALAALDVLIEEPEWVDRLNTNADLLREGLKTEGFDVGDSQTPIIPVSTGTEMTTVLFWKDLLEAGIYTNPVIFPVVPKGSGILRTSCMATQTREQIEQAVQQFRLVGRKRNVIS